jgi:hypothetical protein
LDSNDGCVEPLITSIVNLLLQAEKCQAEPGAHSGRWPERSVLEKQNYASFRGAVKWTDSVMQEPGPSPRSAMDALVESFSQLRSEARKRMPKEEFRRAEESFDDLVRRVRARSGFPAQRKPGS